MSREIEERVVEMRFNNANFEKNAAATMSTLDKLKEKLTFKGLKKGAAEFGSAYAESANKIEATTGKVQASFSALQVVAMTTLSRITNTAISAGVNIAKSLTIDPVKTGLSEYELKLNSIQTILANTKRHGSTLEDVSNALDELNHYADLTIYNFGQMTTAIGMFTTAGVDLDRSVASVKGISNLAAFVGAPAQDATRAMYQLSQALSTGSVRLQDWMSLEHTAGMAGVEFQDRLKDTARILGENVDAAIAKNGNFRESLKEGWLTTEVLTETLKQFAGEVDETYLKQQGWNEAQIQSIMDLGRTATEAATVVKSFTQLLDTSAEAAQSGWAESWEIIIGSLEEAKELWTGASKVISGFIDANADARNKILRGWKDLGGRTDLIQGVVNVFKALESIVKPIKDAFRELFPPMTVQSLYNLTKGFKEFAAQMKLSEESAYTLKVAVKALLLPLKLTFEVLKVGAKVGITLVGILIKMGDAFLSLFSKANPLEGLFRKIFGDSRYVRLAKSLNTVTNKIASTFGKITDKIRSMLPQVDKAEKSFSVFERIGNILGSIAGFVLDSVVAGFEKLASINFAPLEKFATTILVNIQNHLKSIGSFVTNAKDGLLGFFEVIRTYSASDLFGLIAESTKTLIKYIKELFSFGSGSEDGGFFGDIKEKASEIGDAFEKLGLAVVDFTKRLTPAKILVFSFGTALTATLFTLNNTLKSFTGLASSATTVIKSILVASKPSKIAEISRALTLLAGALVAMSLVKPENLRRATISMVELMGALTVMTAVMGILDKKLLNAETFVKTAAAMQTMGIALMTLSASLLLLTKVPMDISLIGKVAAIAALMLALAGSLKILGALDVNLGKNVLFVLAFAVSIGTIIKALEKISSINFNQIIAGLGSMTLIMGLLAGISVIAGRAKFGSSAGIMLMCFNILLVQSVLKSLAKQDLEQIIEGLQTFLPLLGVMAAIAFVANRIAPDIAKAGLGIAAISASFVILQTAIKNIGTLSLGEVTKGTAAVVAILAMFGLISQNMRRVSQNATKLGKSILIMSTALLPLTLVIKMVGSFKLDEVIQGTLVVTALFSLFTLILKFGTTAEKATAPILSITLAIGMLSTAIGLLSLLPAKDLLASSVAISAALAAFGYAMSQMKDIEAASIVKSIAAMAAILASIIGIFLLFDNFDTSKVNLEFIDTISKAVVSLSTMMFALGKVGNLGLQPALIAVGTLDLILISLGALLIGAGALMENEKIQKFATQGVQFFGLIGQAVGALVGGVIQQIGVQIAAGMPLIANSLSEFMTNLQPFIAAVSAIDLSFVTGIALLAAGMIALNAGGAVTAVIGLFGGGGTGVAIMAKELPLFGEAVKAFSDKITQNGGIDAEAVTASAALASAMAELQKNLPTNFGFVDLLLGSKVTLDEFGTKMVTFGESMVTYSNTITANGGINHEAIQASVDSATLLRDLEDNLPRKYGVMQAILGSKSLTIFGGELVTFGQALVDYSNTITSGNGINTEAVEISKNAAQMLSDLESGLPRENGLLQFILGGKSLDTFGADITKLGEGIKAYSDTITANGGINKEAIDTSKLAMDSLVALSKSMDESGGVKQWFGGDKGLDNFGSDLTKLGNGLASFSNSISGIDFSLFYTATDAMNKLTEAPTEIGTNIADELIHGLAYQYQTVMSAGEGLANSVIAGIKNLLPEIQKVGGEITTKFIDGAKEKSETLKTAIAVLISSAFPRSNGDSAFTDAYNRSGKAIVSGLSKGIKDNKSSIKKVVEDLVTEVINSAYKVLDIVNFSSREFEKIGAYIVTGLSNGIEKDNTSVMNAVVSLSNRVLETFRSFFQIQSPSKLMRDEVGRYIVRGISEGITTDTSAEEAAEQKANNIANAFKTAFDKIDLKKSTMDLEDQLWTALHPKATKEETEKRAKEKLDQELKFQAEAVRTAEAEYQAVIQVMGKTSDQATSAYNKLLQEKIELAQLAQQLAGEKKQVAQGTQVDYARLMGENREDLMKMGFTEEQIMSWAEERSGYKPGQVVKNQIDDTLESAISSGNIEGIMKAYLDPIPEVIVKTIDEGIQNGTKAASSGGASMGASVGTGFTSGLASKADDIKTTVQDTIGDLVGGEIGLGDIKDKVSGSLSSIVDGLITGIDEKGSGWISKLGDLASSGLSKFNSVLGIASPSKEFSNSGKYIVEGLDNGIRESRTKFENEMEVLASNGTTKFGLAMNSGLKQASANANSSITNMVNDMNRILKENESNFKTKGKDLGKNIVAGLIVGIQENRSDAINTITNLALDTYKAAKEELEIASPSKKFEELGQFVSLGFAKGISNESGSVSDASNTLVDNFLDDTTSAILHANKIIEDQNYSPIIRPVIDLQQVQDTMDTLNADYSTDLAVDASSGYARSRKAAKAPVKYNPKVYRDNYGLNAGKGGAYSFSKIGGSARNVDSRGNITFIQNNTSPKALSSSTIYRNTKNQFSSMASKLKNARTTSKKS